MGTLPSSSNIDNGSISRILQVDQDGTPITSSGPGTSTEYTEDAASAGGESGPFILGLRRDADTSPVSNDGDFHPLVFNEVGRLKTAGAPALYTPVTGSITANGQTVSADVSAVSNVVMYCTGTFSTVNCTFEGSIDGGTTWFGIQAVRTNANTVELTTGNLSAAPAYAWKLSVNALTNVRVRATAFTSGSQNWRFILGAYATEPIPAIQTHAVTGSGNFAVTMAANATTTPVKAEDAAHANADTGIPALGVRYETNNLAPTSAAGDYGFMQIDDMGKLVTSPHAPPVNQRQGITAAMTGTADTAVLAAAGASIRNYVTGIHVVNTHATVGTEVQIKDGTTVIDRFYVPALSERTREYPVPLKGTANTAINAANVTTGSNTYVQAVGFVSI